MFGTGPHWFTGNDFSTGRGLCIVADRAGRHETVIVLDFGAQYVQLIVRKVREHNVYSEIRPSTITLEEIQSLDPKGIILSGGPNSVYAAGAPTIDPAILKAGIPVLGICYGQQLMAHLLGGKVAGGDEREYGYMEIEVVDDSDLFAGVECTTNTWMSHGDRVEEPPPGFSVLAKSSHSPVAAMGDPDRKLYGVQFHPEVHHTACGSQVLHNFLYDICGCSGDWEPGRFIHETVDELREKIGDDRVLCGVSGGVDSMTTAALLDRAVGSQVTCMFINHGLLRLNEAEQVREVLSGWEGGARFHYVDATDEFLSKLEGVTDPEDKRSVIGETFIRTFERECEVLGEHRYIAHGTLYPDVIESGGQVTARIKTHHNVGGLPEEMAYEENIEPLRWLFKDEVRRIGRELGLPEEVTERQPFPGPGLAVRIVGAVTRERLDLLREADAIFRQELKDAGLWPDLAQCFAVLLADVRSVGVMGDERSYAHPVILRAVTTEDFMTADWAPIPHDVLARISNRIVNEVRGVNRVVYDITSKPPGTIEWE